MGCRTHSTPIWYPRSNHLQSSVPLLTTNRSVWDLLLVDSVQEVHSAALMTQSDTDRVPRCRRIPCSWGTRPVARLAPGAAGYHSWDAGSLSLWASITVLKRGGCPSFSAIVSVKGWCESESVAPVLQSSLCQCNLTERELPMDKVL